MLSVLQKHMTKSGLGEILAVLEKEAIAIAEEDRNVNSKISQYGAELFTNSPVSVFIQCSLYEHKIISFLPFWGHFHTILTKSLYFF
jgi:methylthioribose-1-phosphate isomerase